MNPDSDRALLAGFLLGIVVALLGWYAERRAASERAALTCSRCGETVAEEG